MAVDRKFESTAQIGEQRSIFSREEEEQSSENDSEDAESGSETYDRRTASVVHCKDRSSLNASFVKHGGNSLTVDSRSQSVDDGAPCRLLVVSSKIKNGSVMQSAILPNIVFLQYKYETSSLDSCMAMIGQQLNGKTVKSVAFVLHTSQTSIHVTGKDEKVLNKDISTDQPQSETVREFFRNLVSNHMKLSSFTSRIDFLACNSLPVDEADFIANKLHSLIGVPVYIHKDIMGAELQQNSPADERAKQLCVGDLYFRADKMRLWSGRNQTLAGFEKIRTVGKGAYGTAVLYKKKDDDSLVILKEINLHDLNVGERQLAQNEICVLAMLDHPNIIGYYDSFEEDGVLMIEMEYADGGTLAQYLAQCDKPLEERQILEIFNQVAHAIKHIHQHNILHRDLKTANIFMTKEGIVKLGDFGISKLMTSANGGANSVLGTPYYISPEMCEGKPYNDKSDIWALGCILYEMACLQRTFEGSNLPALVNKIMKGQFAPVRGNYSEEFKTLIMDMLQQDPEKRPSAADLCNVRLPQLMHCYENQSNENIRDNKGTATGSLSRSHSKQKANKSRSVLYYFRMSNVQLIPVELPSKIKLRHVSVGSDHVIVITMEEMVYSWGDGSKGQLGHGNHESKLKPCPIETLKGKSIIRAHCGDGFSVFGSDNGLVLTCGDGSTGCLGHGDWSSVTRPRLIEALLSVDVTSLSAGLNHVIAVSSEGDVFSWGQGSHGRLGLGSDDNHCQPMEVALPESDVTVRECRGGIDGSVLITDIGSVFACGNNEYNKLGLNQRQGFLMTMKNMFNKCEVSEMKTFTVVRALARHCVLDVSLGMHHTSVLVEPGHVYSLGRNSEAQLGCGNTKPQVAPVNVKQFQNRHAVRVQCGDYYTAAATVDSELLLWGRRSKSHHTDSLLAQGHDYDTVNNNNNDKEHRYSETVDFSPEQSDQQQYATDALQQPQTETLNRKSLNSQSGSSSSSSKSDSAVPKEDIELLLQPIPLLRLDASHHRHSSGSCDVPLTLTLSNFFTHGDNLFLQVETTAPPARRASKKRKKMPIRRRAANVGEQAVLNESRNLSVSSHEGGDEYSSEASELDNTKNLPAWLQSELHGPNTEVEPSDSNEAECTSEHSDNDDVVTSATDDSAANIRINTDLLKPTGKSLSKSTLQLRADMSSSPPVVTLSKTSVTDSITSSNSSTLTEPSAAKKPPLVASKRPVSSVNRLQPADQPQSNPRPRARPKRPNGSVGPKVIEDDIKTRQHDLSVLRVEMENLREEKKKTEERLQRMEEEQQKQKERLAMEAAKQSAEKETELVRELVNLRQELQQQSSQLRMNHQVIVSLQDELSRVRQEQDRMLQSEKETTQQKQGQRQSRICVLQ